LSLRKIIEFTDKNELISEKDKKENSEKRINASSVFIANKLLLQRLELFPFKNMLDSQSKLELFVDDLVIYLMSSVNLTRQEEQLLNLYYGFDGNTIRSMADIHVKMGFSKDGTVFLMHVDVVFKIRNVSDIGIKPLMAELAKWKLKSRKSMLSKDDPSEIIKSLPQLMHGIMVMHFTIQADTSQTLQLFQDINCINDLTIELIINEFELYLKKSVSRNRKTTYLKLKESIKSLPKIALDDILFNKYRETLKLYD